MQLFLNLVGDGAGQALRVTASDLIVERFFEHRSFD